METLINFICVHADYAPLWIFGLLILGGLNVPVGEDFLLIIAGILASTCLPDHPILLFVSAYLGSAFAAWEQYGIGRYFGPHLYEHRFFSWAITAKRITKLHEYYEKFGTFAFILARLMTGAMRSVFFLSSGLGKMPFAIFALRDAFACLVGTGIFFALGYIVGENHELIIRIVHDYKEVISILVVIIFLIILARIWYQRTRSNP